MLFNSIEFALFLPIAFYIYWALNKKITLQNWYIVLMSYIFYAWWDWRFLSLVIFTSFSTFFTGILIAQNSKNKAKVWLWVNIVLNLSILGFFKYFDFFTENLIALASFIGLDIDKFTLNILLPIGISFYTFQAISYSVDVYKNKIEPTRNVGAFLAYIAFFPQLIAGPIEKATSLLPQFLQKRNFDYYQAVIGLRQILWGLAKKILIADNCAHYSDKIFGDPEFYAGSSIILAIFLFFIQAYADYSGYSDIAIGIGRLFGIKLSKNFNFPLFSRSIAEFWRRWNMTLMQWFRDYIYIPLGGSHKGLKRQCINILIVFVISGLWHGADWISIIWGITNAMLILPYVIFKIKKNKGIPSLRDFPAMLTTFIIAAFISVGMRCQSLNETINFLSYASLSSGQWNMPTGKTPIFYIIPMIIIEWLGRRNDFALEKLPKNIIIRWSIYFVLLLLIIYGTSFETQSYIYFQF